MTRVDGDHHCYLLPNQQRSIRKRNGNRTGAISAGTAGVITLALGKAYIEVCKAIKMGKLDQSDLTKKAGLDMLKLRLRRQHRLQL